MKTRVFPTPQTVAQVNYAQRELEGLIKKFESTSAERGHAYASGALVADLEYFAARCLETIKLPTVVVE